MCSDWLPFSSAAIITGRSTILFSCYLGPPLSESSDWVIAGERQFNGIQGHLEGRRLRVKCCNNPRLWVQFRSWEGGRGNWFERNGNILPHGEVVSTTIRLSSVRLAPLAETWGDEWMWANFTMLHTDFSCVLTYFILLFQMAITRGFCIYLYFQMSSFAYRCVLQPVPLELTRLWLDSLCLLAFLLTTFITQLDSIPPTDKVTFLCLLSLINMLWLAEQSHRHRMKPAGYQEQASEFPV